MKFATINELCDVVRETAFAIHRFHGCGHLDKVYENALAHRLRLLNVAVEQQQPLCVFDEDGTVLGNYCADLVVERVLLVELKAAKRIADEHIAQLLGYLRSARLEQNRLPGQLINDCVFGPVNDDEL